MTDLERMADEAGAFMPSEYWSGTIYELARFADLIRADERERCAKICDGLATFVHPMAQQGGSPMQHMGAQITYGEHAMAMRAAAAIRASS